MKHIRELLLRENHICPWWLAYTFDNPLRQLIHNPGKLLGPYLKEGMVAVDIGCGMGFFSRGMARMVGNAGNVIAVDLQQEMLNITRKRAVRDNIANRIRFVKVEQGNIGISEQVDLVLAFWMVHEVSDVGRFFEQVSSVLKATGAFLIAEPKMHVTRSRFDEILTSARAAGFVIIENPPIRFSRAAVLKKENPASEQKEDLTRVRKH